MAIDNLVITNPMGARMQQKLQARQYDELLEMLIDQRSLFQVLFFCANEDTLIAFYDHYGPSAEDEVCSDDCDFLGNELLLPAYRHGYYRLAARIYSTVPEWIVDPLCGARHPLAFSAVKHDTAFAQAYITGQERFFTLCFDGDRLCEDGLRRTILEEIVLSDDDRILEMCLLNGANPNAFTYGGSKLWDCARSQKTRDLLVKYGGKPATDEERNLIRVYNQLRHKCLQENAIEALLSSDKPLLTLTWRNGYTPACREHTANILLEAAWNCHSQLLERLYPLVRDTLDDNTRVNILMDILGQGRFWNFEKALQTLFEDIIQCLETLWRMGFRCPADPDNSSRITLRLIQNACHTIFDSPPYYSTIRRQAEIHMLTLLWQMGCAPQDPAFLKGLQELLDAAYIPAALEEFVDTVVMHREV